MYTRRKFYKKIFSAVVYLWAYREGFMQIEILNAIREMGKLNGDLFNRLNMIIYTLNILCLFYISRAFCAFKFSINA